MKKKLTIVNQLELTVFVLLLVLNFGCSKSQDVPEETSGSTGLTSNDAPPPSNFLWVHHKGVKGSLRYTHKKVTSGSWTDQCRVDLDAVNPADRDIVCTTESTELDLMTLGLTMKFNVPTSLKCPYVFTMSPYFFQYEPPRNDSAVNPSTPAIEPQYVRVIENRLGASPTYSAVGYYDSGLTQTNPYFFSTGNSGSYRCGFDYTLADGPNCCEGRYTEVNTLIDTENPAPGLTTYRQVSWGGKRSSCLNGPALALNRGPSGWPVLKVWRMEDQVDQGVAQAVLNQGFESPMDVLSKIEHKIADDVKPDGLNFGEFVVQSLYDKELGTTRYLATHYTGTMPKGFSDLLDYYDSADGLGLHYMAAYADPRYYTVICTDDTKEVKARIRVAIREWNTRDALKAATEPTGNEDNIGGVEDEFPDFPNGDYLDWNDTDGWYRYNGATTQSSYPGDWL